MPKKADQIIQPLNATIDEVSDSLVTSAKRLTKKGASVKMLHATHKGNFKDEFGIDVECYVLDDENKTAVISQRGMGTAIGLTNTSGKAFTRFVGGKTIAPYLGGGELRDKIENPLRFQTPAGGAGQPPPSDVNGYDVTLLIDVCKAIIKAESEGKLKQERYKGIAKQAHVIINASAKAGIKGLVYALAGYDQSREEVIKAFKFYVREAAREYEREFPEELYDEWYRLYELPRPDKNRPWKFKHLTEKQVYEPLARSNGKVLELTKEKRQTSGRKHNKLHQFLSEVGVKALRVHLGKLTGIASISKDAGEYERHFKKVFGHQLEMDLDNGDKT